MPRFAPRSQIPLPAAAGRNPVLPANAGLFPPAPVPGAVDPITTGGIGGRNVSFTTGGATLQALRERQQRLQEEAPQLPSVAGMQSPWQGAAYLANTLVNSLGQASAAAQEQRGTKAMMDVFGHIDPATGATGDQISQIAQYDPEFAIKLWQDRATRLSDAAKQEHWVDIPAPEGSKPGQVYQKNSITGEIRAVGGGGLTVNTGTEKLPENASNIINYYTRGGLANEDVNDLENELTSKKGEWLQKVPLGNFFQDPKYQTAVRAGKDFLAMILRKDTGAAVTQQEFEQYADLYIPLPGDGPEAIAAKRQARQDALDTLAISVEGTAPGTLEKSNALITKRRAEIAKRRQAAGGTTPPPADTGDGGDGGTTPPPVATETKTPPVDGGWPEGVTEEDIQATLKAHPAITRDQLKKSMNKPRAAANGP